MIVKLKTSVLLYKWLLILVLFLLAVFVFVSLYFLFCVVVFCSLIFLKCNVYEFCIPCVNTYVFTKNNNRPPDMKSGTWCCRLVW